jgi:transposase
MSSRAVPLVAAVETEVTEKAKRRTFTAEYKRRILRQADACSKPGELGALLRSEGLYSSHLAVWRRARRNGEMDGLAPKRRGRKPAPIDPRDKKIRELEVQLARANRRAERAEGLVAVQKKVAELLGIPLENEKS